MGTTEPIPVLLFINYFIIFHMNYKPTSAQPCIILARNCFHHLPAIWDFSVEAADTVEHRKASPLSPTQISDLESKAKI